MKAFWMGIKKNNCMKGLLNEGWSFILENYSKLVARGKIALPSNQYVCTKSFTGICYQIQSSVGSHFLTSKPHSWINNPVIKEFYKPFGAKEKNAGKNHFSFSCNVFYPSQNTFQFFDWSKILQIGKVNHRLHNFPLIKIERI